ncbi:MAG: YegS/Rv2252/BmrU family lipid kinase [Bacteroidetes bacterium]|nr:YegS/Rv2252/BmrU family lipid kinase [Bacteroidota bacterium]
MPKSAALADHIQNASSRQTAAGGAEREWFLIVNPASGSGKGKRLQPKVERAMRQAGIFGGVSVSQGPGDLARIAAEAIGLGHRRLALLGGDGTANEVLNGVFSQEEIPATDITLGMLSVGTGNDWMRTIGMPKAPEEGIKALARGNSCLHDVGQVWYGAPEQKLRYFLNITGAGFDGEVTRRVQGWKGFLAGRKLSYWVTILRTLFDYQHTQVVVQLEGQEHRFTALSLAVGICRYNGGGMMQLPEAAYDDGLLDVTVVGKMSTLEMVYRLPMMLDGSFTRLASVHTFRAAELHLDSEPGIWLEADGEVLGRTPARVTCLRQAIRVVVP